MTLIRLHSRFRSISIIRPSTLSWAFHTVLRCLSTGPSVPLRVHQAAAITLHHVLGCHVVLLDLVRWYRGVLFPCVPFHRCRVHAIWTASNPTWWWCVPSQWLFPLSYRNSWVRHNLRHLASPSPVLWSSHSVAVIVNVKSCLSSASSDANYRFGSCNHW